MPSTATAHQLQRVLAPPLRAWLRCAVEGAEHVPPGGPVLFAPNHRSLLDHFLLAAAAPRPVHFLGKQELAAGAVGRLYLATGLVPIARGHADRDALRNVEALLAAGEAVVVFGEGTRSPTGELFRFRSGVARLAAATRTPVVPVGLVGTAAVWPRGRPLPVRRPAPAALRVRFGRPLAPPGDSAVERRIFTDELWRGVAALCGQPRADRFAPVGMAAEAPTGGRDG